MATYETGGKCCIVKVSRGLVERAAAALWLPKTKFSVEYYEPGIRAKWSVQQQLSKPP